MTANTSKVSALLGIERSCAIEDRSVADMERGVRSTAIGRMVSLQMRMQGGGDESV